METMWEWTVDDVRYRMLEGVPGEILETLLEWGKEGWHLSGVFPSSLTGRFTIVLWSRRPDVPQDPASESVAAGAVAQGLDASVTTSTSLQEEVEAILDAPNVVYAKTVPSGFSPDAEQWVIFYLGAHPDEHRRFRAMPHRDAIALSYFETTAIIVGEFSLIANG